MNLADCISADGVELKRAGQELVGLCPFHAERTPSFRVYPDGHYHCFGCGAHGDVVSWRMNFRGESYRQATARLGDAAQVARRGQATPVQAHRDEARRRAAALDIWDGARTIEGTIAAAYLVARGITMRIPHVLRFHGSLRHAPSGRTLPAMLAAVAAADGSFCGVHRTFLSATGPTKANVESAKMSLGPIARGAVRLYAATDQLAIAEGIETALSFTQAERVPSWSCLSTSGLRSVVLPPRPIAATVIIIADADEPGEIAAKAAAERFASEGRRVKIARPLAGNDMNDSLRALGDGD